MASEGSLMEGVLAIVDLFMAGLADAALFFWPLDEKAGGLIAIATAAILAGVAFVRERSGGSFLRFLLPKEVWLHPSALLDYRYVALNGGIKFLLVLPALVPAVWFADQVQVALESAFGARSPTSLAPAAVTAIYTVATLLLSDFLYWVQHWLFHRFGVLWELHKVHHSAEVLTPFTARREHPVEAFVNIQRRLLAFGVVAGVCRFAFPGELSLAEIFGVNAGRYLLFTLAAHLRHSHVWLSWWPSLEHVLLSPAQHHLHHSTAPEHLGKNLGSQFGLWDWMFGTLCVSGEPRPLVYGTGDHDEHRFRTVGQLYGTPLVAIWERLRPARKRVSVAA